MNVEDLDPDDLIGAVFDGERWRLFAGTVAEWILDDPAYDPARDPSEPDPAFRNNVLIVDTDTMSEFI